jgi:hypothetical protein
VTDADLLVSLIAAREDRSSLAGPMMAEREIENRVRQGVMAGRYDLMALLADQVAVVLGYLYSACLLSPGRRTRP